MCVCQRSRVRSCFVSWTGKRDGCEEDAGMGSDLWQEGEVRFICTGVKKTWVEMQPLHADPTNSPHRKIKTFAFFVIRKRCLVSAVSGEGDSRTDPSAHVHDRREKEE